MIATWPVLVLTGFGLLSVVSFPFFIWYYLSIFDYFPCAQPCQPEYQDGQVTHKIVQIFEPSPMFLWCQILKPSPPAGMRVGIKLDEHNEQWYRKEQHHGSPIENCLPEWFSHVVGDGGTGAFCERTHAANES